MEILIDKNTRSSIHESRTILIVHLKKNVSRMIVLRHAINNIIICMIHKRTVVYSKFSIGQTLDP